MSGAFGDRKDDGHKQARERAQKQRELSESKSSFQCEGYARLHELLRAGSPNKFATGGPGRQHIEQFLGSLHDNWSNLKIVVDHAVAEDDWVAGRCTTTAIHAKPVMGVAPTNREVRTTFWDMHRFDADGKIVETWNALDSLAIMQQLGLVPTSGR